MAPGLAAAHRAGQLDRAGVQQQLLGQRRLAGVGMRDDRERAPPRDLALELGLGGGVDAAHLPARTFGGLGFGHGAHVITGLC